MTKDPFMFEGPTLWSFSGGRTSAYMLWRALQTYGGNLPEDHVVAFANTGKEREETLTFVHRCSQEWGVRVVWLEFLARSGPLEARFEVVGPNSASRNGEPFTRLIESKNYLPNATQRFCTEELKVKTVKHYLMTVLGWSAWNNAVGLRHDEGHRVLKSLGQNHEQVKGKIWTNRVPLANAKVIKSDVMDFWAQQNFDLGLKSYEGNCDLCFLKPRSQIAAIMRERPQTVGWWKTAEQAAKGRFVTEFSYSGLSKEVSAQGHLFEGYVDQDEFDAECGTWCGLAS